MLELIAAAALATAGPADRRYEWRPLYRPLRIPAIAPGTPCPAAPARGRLAGSGMGFSAFGPGPAYPTLANRAGRAAIGLVWPPDDPARPGWAGTKVLWWVPRYDGAVLIRGRQLDGPNRVGFDLGPRWTRTVLPELRLVGPTSARPRRSSKRPGATPTRSTRCAPAIASCSRRTRRAGASARRRPRGRRASHAERARTGGRLARRRSIRGAGSCRPHE